MTCRFNIYCVTNKVNGKRYVGQTTSTIVVRWKDHVASAKRNEGCRVLGAAIRKYGVESFELETIEVVSDQEEADNAEAKWISGLQSRVPHGYNLTAGGGGNGRHHDESKRLIGEASLRHWHKMTPEQQAAKIKKFQSNPEKRLARVRETNSTKEFRAKVRDGQKNFWAQLSVEEKTRRVKHQQSGMSKEAKSDRIRKAWAKMSPEARAARVRKAAEGVTAAKTNPAHIKKMSEWQTEQAKRRTPEQRQAMVLKSWETRRAKYGKKGHSKSSEVFSAATRKGWANMTPEARIERGRKIKEGRRLAREARAPQLIRINLFSPAIQ